ncbi:MAG: hypothetical protein ACE14S_06960 [Candidatus Bathyarchaeia archaeon]
MSKSDFKLDFPRLLNESVSEALSSLGESPKQTLLFHLEKNFSISQNAISDNVGAFDHALRSIFGASARLLESIIIRRLDQKAGISFEGFPNDDFTGTVASLRHRLEG